MTVLLTGKRTVPLLQVEVGDGDGGDLTLASARVGQQRQQRQVAPVALGVSEHAIDLLVVGRGLRLLGHRDPDPGERVGLDDLLGQQPGEARPQAPHPVGDAARLVLVGEVLDEPQRLELAQRRHIAVAAPRLRACPRRGGSSPASPVTGRRPAGPTATSRRRRSRPVENRESSVISLLLGLVRRVGEQRFRAVYQAR